MESKSHIQQIRDFAKVLGAGGCSGVPDFEFTHCCDEHDISYALHKDPDGNKITKLQADLVLWHCMNTTGKNWFGRWILSTAGFIGLTFLGWKAWWNGH